MPYLAIGKYFVEQNNPELAEKFINDGLKYNFADKDYLYGIVELYEKSMLTDKALLYLKKILNDYPDDIAQQFQQGLIFFKDDKHSEAINRFKSIISKDAGHIDALFHLGMTYEKKGDHEGAKEIYNKILKTKPDNPETLVRLGSLYLSEPDYVKAKECF
jgi:tetratricopeptide (TPR) repeat protein